MLTAQQLDDAAVQLSSMIVTTRQTKPFIDAQLKIIAAFKATSAAMARSVNAQNLINAGWSHDCDNVYMLTGPARTVRVDVGDAPARLYFGIDLEWAEVPNTLTMHDVAEFARVFGGVR